MSHRQPDFHRGELDLALFGGVTFVRAERRDGAVPLVMRVIDRHFSSVVIARAGLEGEFPGDFRGRSFAFGPVSSTSGNHMPRHFFDQAGWDPEKLFGSVTHQANHDAVIAAVGEGRADLGLVNSQVFRQRLADGSVEPRRFRVMWETPHYSDYVWAAPASMPVEIRSRLRLAFLNLDIHHPAHREFMAPLGARSYVPATRADFNLARERVTGSATYAQP